MRLQRRDSSIRLIAELGDPMTGLVSEAQFVGETGEESALIKSGTGGFIGGVAVSTTDPDGASDSEPPMPELYREQSGSWHHYRPALLKLAEPTQIRLRELELLEPVDVVLRELQEMVGRSHEVQVQILEDEVFDPPYRVAIEMFVRRATPDGALEVEERISDWIFDSFPPDTADRLLVFIRPV